MDRDLTAYLSKAVWTIADVIGTRPIGSAGNRRTLEYLSETLSALGYSLRRQEFSKTLSATVGSTVTAVESGSAFDSWPAFGSTGGDVRAPVIDCSEWNAPGLSATRGKIALLRRGIVHEDIKLTALAAAGALGALLYVEYENALYSPRVSRSASAIPAAVIRRQDANWLAARPGADVSLSVRAGEIVAPCTNLIATHPRLGAPSILVCAHFDSRPNTPGANDNAGGAACVLGVARWLAALAEPPPVEIVFFDGEEMGCVGSRFFAGDPTTLAYDVVINVDAVGSGRLSCIVKDRDGDLDGGLAELALALADEHGIALKTAVARTGTSDHGPLREKGCRALWFSDHPNSGRETDLDVAAAIDPAALAAVVRLIQAAIARLTERRHDMSALGNRPG